MELFGEISKKRASGCGRYLHNDGFSSSLVPVSGRVALKRLLVPALLVGSLALGCASAHLHPVQGPLSKKTPPPVYSFKMSGVFYSGTFSTKLNDGETFKGDWSTVPKSTTSTAPVGSLSAEWDAVYGAGFFKLRVLEAQFYVRGQSKGSRGTMLNIEMYKNEYRSALASKSDDSTTIEMKGVAKDDKGNIYQVTFK
jgi:hypothetical protein